jgi:hypothetical protein
MEENAIQKRARLEKEIEEFKRKLKKAQNALADIDRYCQHEWGEEENADIYHKGYRSPGDPVGTMGVDRRFACSVPSRTEKRWKRVCKKCNKIDYTKCTNETTVKTPRW